MIRAIIVEDEEKSRKLLYNLICKYCADVNVVDSCATIPTGIKAIDLHKPDLVFLDIVFPGSDGFSLLKQVQYRDFEVIFTTAYDEYALQAIKNSAMGYLLKPINIDELEEILEKVKERLPKRRIENTLDEKLKLLVKNYENFNRDEQKLGIPTQNGIRFINIKDISHCQADGNYTMIHLVQPPKRELASKTLKDFEEHLSAFNFIRVHRSYLINLQYVKEYQRSSFSDEVDSDGGCVVMLNNAIIPVSRDKRKLLLKRFSKPF
jgi:two-component system LytT family response regulator